MRIAIAGEIPFVDEVERLCLRAAHDVRVFLVEDFWGAIEAGQVADRLADVEIAIEVHNESAAAKQELLLVLSDHLPPDALILTSALATSATQAASWVARPERVVGFGFVPPIAGGGLVEVAAALQTSEAALSQAELFWRGLGQEPIFVADGPGLVRARVVCCLINEAAGLLLEGVATATDIDRAMRLGTNYPYGPLAWGDLMGLDAVLGVMTGLFNEWGDDRYRPSPMLRRLVAAGRLGVKTGQGFYPYPE